MEMEEDTREKDKENEEAVVSYCTATYWNGKSIHEKELIKKSNIKAIKELFGKP